MTSLVETTETDALPATNALPRRVLHVLNSAAGGAALSTLDLIRTCRRHDIDAVAVCHAAGTKEEFDRLRDAVDGRLLVRPLYWMNKKIRSPLWKRPAIELLQWWRTGCSSSSSRDVAEFAARHQVDAIHTNTIVTPEGARAARRLGLPHIWHVRELVGPDKPYRFYGSTRGFGRYLNSRATAVVANSNATAECLRQYVEPDRLHVVPNGIDVSRFSVREFAAASSSAPVVVGMVANVAPLKRHDLFLEAAARIDRSLSAEFRIYGHAPTKPGLFEPLRQAVERHGLQDRVKWMGFVGDPRRIMQELDLLVHPCESESFGRIFVEAMSGGVPVVAARGGGAAEIVVDGETGLLVAPQSASELAAAIDRLVRDASLRRTLGRAGRRRVEAEYSLERCAERLRTVYARAIEVYRKA